MKEFLGIWYIMTSVAAAGDLINFSILSSVNPKSYQVATSFVIGLRYSYELSVWKSSLHRWLLNTAVAWPCGSILSHCDVTVNKTLPSEHSCIRWIEEQQQQQNVNHSTVEFLLSCASPPDEECEVVKKWIAQCYFILGVWEVLYLRRLFVKNAKTVMRSRAELQTLQKQM